MYSIWTSLTFASVAVPRGHTQRSAHAKLVCRSISPSCITLPTILVSVGFPSSLHTVPLCSESLRRVLLTEVVCVLRKTGGCGLCKAMWRSSSSTELLRTSGKQWGRKTVPMRYTAAQSPQQPEVRSLWLSILPKPLTYSSNMSDVDAVQLSELWRKTLNVQRDPKKITRALHHSFSFVVVLAEDEGAQLPCRLKTVGVGRAVSDGAFIATICDVAVDPAYRHRGIGRRIVKKLVQDIKRRGGPSGFAVFPPPVARLFFWMIGFRYDKKYQIMAYRGKDGEPDDAIQNQSPSELKEAVEE